MEEQMGKGTAEGRADVEGYCRGKGRHEEDVRGWGGEMQREG